MEPKDLAKLESLFEALIELPRGAQREALARSMSRGDSELARRAISLANANDRATAQNESQRRVAVAPRVYGRYRTLRPIGSGGMGTVYLGGRADGQFEQTVAIKVMAPHAAGEGFRHRFLTERQILAGLNHPNIAKLIDGGMTPDGEPFLVMQYVEGLPLDQYCDGKALGLAERLELFLKVANAVDYAHRNLVVHRDLKPSNILVTEAGEPILLDFGTAKLLAGPANYASATMRLLTPRYSSPEMRSGDAVTTSTDIYSLGIILYELLTGAWPFGDPKSPSDLSDLFTRECEPTPPQGAVTEEAAQNRGETARSLRSGIAGDLSAIALKAMAADADRRYPTVPAFAADIQAYLEGRPVAARQGDFQYRASKFMGRHKAWIAAGFVLAASMIAGVAGVLWQAHIAREAERRAEARADDLRKLSNTLLEDLDNAIQKLPGSTEAQRLLVTAVTGHLRRLSNDAAANDAATQIDMASAYTKLGNIQGNPYDQNLGDASGGLATIDKAVALAQLAAKRDQASNAALSALALAYQSRAEILLGMGRQSEALPAMQSAVRVFETLVKRPNAGVDDLAAASAAYGALGDLLGQPGIGSMNDPQGGLAAYGKNLALNQRILKADPAHERALRGTVIVLFKMANIRFETDPPLALKNYEEALAMARALPAALRVSINTQRVIEITVRHLAQSHEELGEYDAALAGFDEAGRIVQGMLDADSKDLRAVEDMMTVYENRASCLEMRDQEVFGPDPRRQADAAESFDLLTRAVVVGERLLRERPSNDHRVELGYILVRAGVQAHMLGRSYDGSRTGVAMLRQVAAAPDAQGFDLDQAVDGLLIAEPASLRDPALALKAAERMIELTKRKRPDYLLDLARCYLANGDPVRARQTAREALGLYVGLSSTAPFRARMLLQRIAGGN